MVQIWISSIFLKMLILGTKSETWCAAGIVCSWWIVHKGGIKHGSFDTKYFWSLFTCLLNVFFSEITNLLFFELFVSYNVLDFLWFTHYLLPARDGEEGGKEKWKISLYTSLLVKKKSVWFISYLFGKIRWEPLWDLKERWLKI